MRWLERLDASALPATHAGNQYDETKGEVTFHLDVEPAPGVPLREVVGVEVRKAMAADGRELAAAHPAPPPYSGPLGWEEQMVMRQLAMASGDFVIADMMRGPAQPVSLKTGGLRPTKLAEVQGVVVARVVTPPEEPTP